MARLDIKNKVNEIIKRYKTNDPYKIAEALDVILLFVPLKGVNGFYNYYKRNHIIYINEDLEEEEQRITLAHELGHLVLHKNTNAIYLNTTTALNTQKFEREADIFASELLISDNDIIDNVNLTAKTLSKILCVKEKHINYKYENLKEGLKWYQKTY